MSQFLLLSSWKLNLAKTFYSFNLLAFLDRNELLPLSQKLTSDDLKLDERITDDLQEKLDFQMSIVRRRMQFDFERVKLAGLKLKSYFIEPIDLSIQVMGIRNGKSVFSFRMRKLGDDFFRLEDEWRLKQKQEMAKKRL